MKYWTAIKKYARGILDIYYENNDAIKNDSEVQNWIGEVKVKYNFQDLKGNKS